VSQSSECLIKINVGSGTNVVEGWINIDKSWNVYLSRFTTIKKVFFKLGLISEGTYRANWKGKKIKKCDVTKGLPFKSGSVDVIYCSHLIEHLTHSQAMKLCEEFYKILKNNGIMRIVTPDLKLYARKYIEDDRVFFGNSKTPIADLFLNSLSLDGLSKRPFIEKLLYRLHMHMYDSESLTFLLELVGFKTINVCKYREGLCPDLKIIENRKRSIYIEALK